MLFERERHETRVDRPWDEALVRAGIADLVAEIERARLPGDQWPVHPGDVDGPTPDNGFKSLYLGSAGLLWALWYLQREGAITLRADPCQAINGVAAAYRAAPDTGSVVPSYFLGEVGIELMRWRMTGSADAADRLYTAVEANIPNPTNEALWAAPGTMVAAWHLWAATADARWRTLYLANGEQLWRTWQDDAEAGCMLWTQDLYGSKCQLLGAGHGFAGNVYPLLKGAALLDPARRQALYARTLQTLLACELRDGEASNWPPGIGAPRPGRDKLLMQWCHGAPGIVTGLANFPVGLLEEMDALLLRAGEAVWRAGPISKGPGLCHGTAGNGYALLALHRRSGDAYWLDRARAFAMHALDQSQRQRRAHGQGRHSLWTGDAGVAVYLWHCVRGDGGMPGLDVID